MQTRAVRLSLLALLLVTGLGAGLVAWDTQQRLDVLLTVERDIDARFDRLARNVAAFGAAQTASVVAGQAQGDALAQGSALLKQIDEDLAALRSRSRSTAGVAAFSAFSDTLESAVKTDSRAREHLRIGQELMAADLVVSEGRQSIEALSEIVGDLRRTEQEAADEDRRALKSRAAKVVGAVTLLWVIGLFVLARDPRDDRARGAEEARLHPYADPHRRSADAQHDDRNRESLKTRGRTPLDIGEAAAVCTALSRVSTGAEIPAVLAHAAEVLDASGIILWLGAGEDLFAATSHGYHPRVLARLGPIRRNAENATAAAWRACALRVVQGDATHNGAVVAPLFGPSTSLGPWSDGCIGVLTAEVRGGRENDPTTQAVTAIIAAQLATIVAAWPAPSAIEGPSPSAVAGSGRDHEPRSDEGQRETTSRDVPSEAADDPTAPRLGSGRAASA
jgi:hypothetical protein